VIDSSSKEAGLISMPALAKSDATFFTSLSPASAQKDCQLIVRTTDGIAARSSSGIEESLPHNDIASPAFTRSCAAAQAFALDMSCQLTTAQ